MSADVLIAGVLAGGLYALIGLGISLVFGVLKMMNLMHGELVIGGAYLASLLVGYAGLDPLLALPFAMLGMAALTYPLQRYLLTGLLRASPNAPLVATFGLSLVAQAVLQAAFGTHPKAADVDAQHFALLLGEEPRRNPRASGVVERVFRIREISR